MKFRLLLALAVAPLANAELVSVTTDAVTGGNAAAVTAERLANAGDLFGPAGDSPGSIWNIISGFDATGLLDSTGAPTTIGYSTTFSERRGTGLNEGDLEIARTYMQDFGKGGSNTITINGLTPGGFYNVWLVSVSNSGAGTEFYRGDFITTNTTSSPSTQTVISSPRNVTTFEVGQNYAVFENVVADESGEISFVADAANLDGEPNTGDEYRFGLNGFQIEKTTPLVVGEVDDAMSTVVASPETVFANGVSTSSVTVTLKDSDGNGVPNRDVTLANTGGPQAATIDPLTAQTTNGSGQATFTVSSSTPGFEEFTATDVTDTLTLTDTASVEFIEVGVLSDAAVSTVVASPPSVLADGVATSTVTVTLLDANGFPVSGKEVTLANTSGPGTAVIAPGGAVTSDANGEAVFTVSSTTVGVEEFTATDTTDSVVVTQVAPVGFIDSNAPQTINVNFNGFTGGNPGPTQDAATLEGPAGGLNTAWNQFTANSSGGTLIDSTSQSTSVGFTTNFSEGRYDGPGAPLTMLRATLTDFNRGLDNRNLTITGLNPGGYYNIWLVSFRGQNAEAERIVGWWSTTNSTTSPSDQLINSANGEPLNNSTFVEGYNYVLFEKVEANESGEIVFSGVAGTLLDGSDDGFRHGLNGFQLEETQPPFAQILSFTAMGAEAVINENAKTIDLRVPFGTNLATLAPEFTLSTGTSNQTSGAPPSPTFAEQNPVDYVVTDDSTDPVTVNTYEVTVTVAPQIGTLVIDLGAGTVIPGASVILTGPTNLPLPPLPTGSILRGIDVDLVLESSDQQNFASDLSLLFDPTPGTPGEDYTLEITNGTSPFGGTEKLSWPTSAEAEAVTPLVDAKTDTDWAGAGDIDLGTSGVFLGNAFGSSGGAGTWSGTITLIYDVVSAGSEYDTWSGGAPFEGDQNGDAVGNGLAFLLGAANPNADASSLLPTVRETGGGLVLSFSVRNAASRGTAVASVQWSGDLGISDLWADNVAAVPDSTSVINGVDFQITVNGSLNDVVATIPSTEAADGRLFGRVNGSEN